MPVSYSIGHIEAFYASNIVGSLAVHHKGILLFSVIPHIAQLPAMVVADVCFPDPMH